MHDTAHLQITLDIDNILGCLREEELEARQWHVVPRTSPRTYQEYSLKKTGSKDVVRGLHLDGLVLCSTLEKVIFDIFRAKWDDLYVEAAEDSVVELSEEFRLRRSGFVKVEVTYRYM
jgi:hypothetical protein